MFQSLLGFLMRCDEVDQLLIDFDADLFQSLLGFLMRCDAIFVSRHGSFGFNPCWVF